SAPDRAPVRSVRNYARVAPRTLAPAKLRHRPAAASPAYECPLQRRGVAVRTRLHTALAIDHRKANLGQLESLRRQRQQMLALDPHGLAHRVPFASHPTLLACTTPGEPSPARLSHTRR